MVTMKKLSRVCPAVIVGAIYHNQTGDVIKVGSKGEQ